MSQGGFGASAPVICVWGSGRIGFSVLCNRPLYDKSIPQLIRLAKSHIADLETKSANITARVEIREILLAKLRRQRDRYRKQGPRAYMEEYGETEFQRQLGLTKMSMTMDQELVLTKEDEIEERVKMTFEDGKGKRVRRVKVRDDN